MLSDIYTYPSAQVAWVPNKTTLKWGALTPSNFRERVVDIWSKSVALRLQSVALMSAPVFGWAVNGPYGDLSPQVRRMKKKYFTNEKKKKKVAQNHFYVSFKLF